MVSRYVGKDREGDLDLRRSSRAEGVCENIILLNRVL